MHRGEPGRRTDGRRAIFRNLTVKFILRALRAACHCGSEFYSQHGRPGGRASLSSIYKIDGLGRTALPVPRGRRFGWRCPGKRQRRGTCISGLPKAPGGASAAALGRSRAAAGCASLAGLCKDALCPLREPLRGSPQKRRLRVRQAMAGRFKEQPPHIPGISKRRIHFLG